MRAAQDPTAVATPAVLYAGKGADGLVFLGEKSAAFRRGTFGRKCARLVPKAALIR
ncbi:hypothetical protein [Streptomyces sp. NPDC093544]|uniref:hypothetical protein n=1 Tax=Streptomyces sp. NPDC093544 TaxID=3155200 RepID=UPI00341F3EFA